MVRNLEARINEITRTKRKDKRRYMTAAATAFDVTISRVREVGR